MDLIRLGETNRSTAATKMNERSSRSHSVLIITIEQKNMEDGSTKVCMFIYINTCVFGLYILQFLILLFIIVSLCFLSAY